MSELTALIIAITGLALAIPGVISAIYAVKANSKAAAATAAVVDAAAAAMKEREQVKTTLREDTAEQNKVIKAVAVDMAQVKEQSDGMNTQLIQLAKTAIVVGDRAAERAMSDELQAAIKVTNGGGLDHKIDEVPQKVVEKLDERRIKYE